MLCRMNIEALPPPLRWREAKEADEPVLEMLFAASREELQHVPQLMRMQRRAHEAGLRQNFPHALRLVIESEGGPVGQAVIDIGAHELRLLDIAVAPEARRCGIARAAISSLQREAASRSLPMGLMVSSVNAAALTLYSQCGFVPSAQDAMIVHMRWRDA
jgi:ribosomal protein S18 acetylase RimI-like enzyme